MRNKKKDLILDFTSLLDIVLLLLFFFILFSKIGADTRIKEAEEEAQKSKNKYESMVEETSFLKEQLQKNIEIVSQLTSQEAEEIISYNTGNNLKVILQGNDDIYKPMTLKVVFNKEIIGKCYVTAEDDNEYYKKNDISVEKMVNWFDKNGLNQDSVILCDFVYDADMPRTNDAYDKIIDIFATIQNKKEYLHFYYSSTDLSVGD